MGAKPYTPKISTQQTGHVPSLAHTDKPSPPTIYSPIITSLRRGSERSGVTEYNQLFGYKSIPCPFSGPCVQRPVTIFTLSNQILINFSRLGTGSFRQQLKKISGSSEQKSLPCISEYILTSFQHCPVEVSVMGKFCICTGQNSSHSSHMATVYLRCSL